MKAHRSDNIVTAAIAAAAVLTGLLIIVVQGGGTAAGGDGPDAGTQEGAEKVAADGRTAFTTEVMNGHTPVKDQGHTPLCWAYAMLSAIETEHIMRGDSVCLSVKYAARRVLEERTARYYLTGDRRLMKLRGTGHTLLKAIGQHGVVPYSAYGDRPDDNFNTLRGGMRQMAAAAPRGKTGLRWLSDRLNEAADEALGPMPHRVFMLGAEYTPLEFAHSVCAPGEYVALTSFTHHPYYTAVDLEIPDNHDHDRFFNIPLDTLTAAVERAVRAGHGVCWEGDISEPGFSFAGGKAVLPGQSDLSEAARQRAFEHFETTDDHCMAITGLARDGQGKLYFIMKNSWGTDNPYGGMMYMSAEYLRMKTVAVFMTYAAARTEWWTQGVNRQPQGNARQPEGNERAAQ